MQPFTVMWIQTTTMYVRSDQLTSTLRTMETIIHVQQFIYHKHDCLSLSHRHHNKVIHIV